MIVSIPATQIYWGKTELDDQPAFLLPWQQSSRITWTRNISTTPESILPEPARPHLAFAHPPTWTSTHRPLVVPSVWFVAIQASKAPFTKYINSRKLWICSAALRRFFVGKRNAFKALVTWYTTCWARRSHPMVHLLCLVNDVTAEKYWPWVLWWTVLTTSRCFY